LQLTFFKKVVYLLLISSGHLAANVQLTLNNVENIKIDGYLSEDSWKNASKITDLHSFRPEEGKPVIEKTAVLLGYDADNLYLACICFYKSPANIRASITRREDIFDDDYIAFFLDTFNDGKNAYIFAFNPFGIQADGIYTENGDEDMKPDFLFESRGRLFSNGYIVEAKVPFSSLNFPDDFLMDWKFAIVRHIQYVTHDITWPAFTINSSEWIGQFGTLTGIKSINKGKGIEILPEFSSFRTDKLGTSGLQDGPVIGQVGLNVKFGISSGLNLDLTYNPDFSQIEADANKIDINRVTPFYYEEKRPFFLEGTEIFNTPVKAFYSRQIADPLGGIKLSGRAGEYSIGFISAVDEYQGREEYLTDVAGQQYQFNQNLDLTPLKENLISKYKSKKSLNNVLRIKRNIFGKSSIGMIATDREFDDSYNRVYGLDGNFSLNNNNVITLQGLFAQTREPGSTEKLAAPAFNGDYDYNSNTWNFQLEYNDYSPDFRLQNGYISRTDLQLHGYRDYGAGIYYEFNQQDMFIQHLQPFIYASHAYNYANEPIEQYFTNQLFFRFNFQTDMTLYYYHYKEKYTLIDSYSDLEFMTNTFAINLNNRSLAWFTPSFYYYFGDAIYYYAPWDDTPPFLGKVNSADVTFVFRPFSSLSTDFAYHVYRFDGGHNNNSNSYVDFSQTQQIARAKINYQISRYFATRLILQNDWKTYDDDVYWSDPNGEFEVNFLLSYTPSPGTVIFLGYNDYQEKTDLYDKGLIFKNYRQQQRGVFLKLSYLFKAAL
jgi:Domain of unknown function (DUF5916)